MEIKKLFDLTGRTALVTGSCQGIGKAIALALAEYGCNIIIHCLDERELAENTKLEIKAFGVEAWIITGDLSDASAPGQIFDQATALTPVVDILVLNVSIQRRNSWQQVSLSEMDLQTALNFRSSLQLCQLFSIPMQQQKWGRILTIGSVQQTKPHPKMIVYAATKAALSNMVKNLALQLACDGITVNNIAPGVINTERNREALLDIPYREKLEQQIPLNFIGEPSDCAPAALLLCSAAGRYITGQDYYIDGGFGL